MTRHNGYWAMCLILNILLGVAFTVVVMAFLDPILYFFGGSDNTVGYARDYMEIILLGNAITHLYLGLNAVRVRPVILRKPCMPLLLRW